MAAAATYRVRHLFPGDSPPLDNACITVQDGQVVAVNGMARDESAIDLGDVAVLPGLVNCHTHLEFSHLAKPLGRSGMPLSEWIPAVVAHRRERSEPAEIAQSIRLGLAESRSSGTAVLGEIATCDWSPTMPADVPDELQLVVFRELLGVTSERVNVLRDAARQHLLREATPATPHAWLPGLSPHAPYTVHWELLETAIQLSVRHHVPLAMHLAESGDELELLAQRRGPLVEMLQNLNAWHPDALGPARCPGDYLEQLARAHRALIIHGNFLTPEEQAAIGQRRSRLSVVFCPRTHAYFAHPAYPLASLRQRGVRVVLGTDSRASNPDLSLLEEMRFLAAHFPAVSPQDILAMGTSDGGQALGLNHRQGSIRPGYRLPWTLVPLLPGATPYQRLGLC
jgi:aminodeoxyfutalosine deaminase